jgi:nicotinamide riboside transporter PnuC
MFHLDYLSCFLTVLATILVGRKSWTGLLFSIVNSLVVCIIGMRTSQFGLIPANLFCVCIYAFSIRSWLRGQRDRSQGSPAVAVRSRTATG